MANEAKQKARAILESLSVEERQLLTKILKIERDWLHQAKPRIQEDLVKAVKESIK